MLVITNLMLALFAVSGKQEPQKCHFIPKFASLTTGGQRGRGQDGIVNQMTKVNPALCRHAKQGPHSRQPEFRRRPRTGRRGKIRR
jgi:hypothetical protein